jgi:hypothetical protein
MRKNLISNKFGFAYFDSSHNPSVGYAYNGSVLKKIASVSDLSKDKLWITNLSCDYLSSRGRQDVFANDFLGVAIKHIVFTMGLANLPPYVIAIELYKFAMVVVGNVCPVEEKLLDCRKLHVATSFEFDTKRFEHGHSQSDFSVTNKIESKKFNSHDVENLMFLSIPPTVMIEDLLATKIPNNDFVYCDHDEAMSGNGNYILNVFMESKNNGVSNILSPDCFDRALWLTGDEYRFLRDHVECTVVSAFKSSGTSFALLDFDLPDFVKNTFDKRKYASFVSSKILYDSIVYGESESIQSYFMRSMSRLKIIKIACILEKMGVNVHAFDDNALFVSVKKGTDKKMVIQSVLNRLNLFSPVLFSYNK